EGPVGRTQEDAGEDVSDVGRVRVSGATHAAVRSRLGPDFQAHTVALGRGGTGGGDAHDLASPVGAGGTEEELAVGEKLVHLEVDHVEIDGDVVPLHDVGVRGRVEDAPAGVLRLVAGAFLHVGREGDGRDGRGESAI